jgi:hypothetical protein
VCPMETKREQDRRGHCPHGAHCLVVETADNEFSTHLINAIKRPMRKANEA